jgi:hypothetical protein
LTNIAKWGVCQELAMLAILTAKMAVFGPGLNGHR